MERLALREQATESLRNNGWRLLYKGVTPLRASVTLLDPSESLQISLQIPLSPTTLRTGICGSKPATGN